MSKYTENLDEKTRKRAKKELNEDEKQIQSHINTLREWVLSRPHLTCKTDDEFLLRFLRVAKYSQVKAQQRLDHYCSVRSSEKLGCTVFFENFNPMDESILRILDLGTMCRLPGYDDDGRTWIYYSEGAVEANKKDKIDHLKAGIMSCEAIMLDPKTQINGVSVISDFTNFTTSHLILSTTDAELRNSSKIWDDCIPIRTKQMHLWNVGSFVNGFWELFKQLMSTKMQNRVFFHKTDTKELKKKLPLKMLPNEFGGSAGTIKMLAEDWKQEVMKHRHYLKSLEEIKVDESKRMSDEVVGSFRKLNVD